MSLALFAATPSFAPAGVQSRAVSAPLKSAPAMGFGKAELEEVLAEHVCAHGCEKRDIRELLLLEQPRVVR